MATTHATITAVHPELRRPTASKPAWARSTSKTACRMRPRRKSCTTNWTTFAPWTRYQRVSRPVSICASQRIHRGRHQRQRFAAFSGLMDASSIFLTPNADTYYLWGYLDLTKFPSSSRSHRECWGCSMTCGGIGLAILASPDLTEGKAESTLICHPATPEMCQRAASWCIRAGPTTRVASVARFSRITTPSLSTTTSRRTSRSIPMRREARGRASAGT